MGTGSIKIKGKPKLRAIEIVGAASVRYAEASTGAPSREGFAAAPSPSIAAPKSRDSTGSGWAISRTQLVTNAHVVAGCSRLVAAGREAVQVQAVDAKSDLALLIVTSNSTVATLRSSRLRQGDAVTVVGYPLSGLLASGANVTAGNVSALAGMHNDTRFIQISAPVQPGNSGGPLLDASGNIVGVVVSTLDAIKEAQTTGNIPQNVGVKGTWKNFAIRSGISYRINDKTVIRAGYGESIIPFPDNSYAYNYPVKQTFVAPNPPNDHRLIRQDS